MWDFAGAGKIIDAVIAEHRGRIANTAGDDKDIERTAARPEVAAKSRDKLISGSPFRKEVAYG